MHTHTRSRESRYSTSTHTHTSHEASLTFALTFCVARAAQWKNRLQWIDAYNGIPGLDDKFIHLSTGLQVQNTAGLYFAGATDLVLLRFGLTLIDEFGEVDVRWEDAEPPAGSAKRDGDFPHAYAKDGKSKCVLPYACLVGPPVPLKLDAAGKHIFPDDL